MNLLFVCTAGEQRSPTAAGIYNEMGYQTRFAGTHGIGEQALTRKDLEWADKIIVMEDMHRDFISRNFPRQHARADLTVLGIPDIYLRNDPELISEIEAKMPEMI